MLDTSQLGVRWTVGSVSDRGFEALRLSVWGAWKLFGPPASYAICVNTLSTAEAQSRAGDLPPGVRWHEATAHVPAFLRHHLDPGMAEGVAWKFAPLQFFPDRFELSLDNDCILWEMPDAIRTWLEQGSERHCVVAEDVLACFGQFADLCGEAPRNGGIRGLPPGFDLEGALAETLSEKERRCGARVRLTSELDEQGLQTAALRRALEPLAVSVDEVSICSPFPPHLPHLGSCGAHFCGLNAHRFPWELEGRNATEWIREHWDRHRAELYERVGIRPTLAGRVAQNDTRAPLPAGAFPSPTWEEEADERQDLEQSVVEGKAS